MELLVLPALQKTVSCLQMDKNKYFYPYNTNAYTIFLYNMSRLCFLNNHITLADKIYYLNKIMHGVDLFYEVELPEMWLCDHPLGTVIGRAKIGNYFSFIQGCAVGNNKGIYPTIGENVMMLSNSKIIGNCKIGDNVVISANTYVKDQDVPSEVIVFGQSPNLIFRKQKSEINIQWKNGKK